MESSLQSKLADTERAYEVVKMRAPRADLLEALAIQMAELAILAMAELNLDSTERVYVHRVFRERYRAMLFEQERQNAQRTRGVDQADDRS